MGRWWQSNDPKEPKCPSVRTRKMRRAAHQGRTPPRLCPSVRTRKMRPRCPRREGLRMLVPISAYARDATWPISHSHQNRSCPSVRTREMRHEGRGNPHGVQRAHQCVRARCDVNWAVLQPSDIMVPISAYARDATMRWRGNYHRLQCAHQCVRARCDVTGRRYKPHPCGAHQCVRARCDCG